MDKDGWNVATSQRRDIGSTRIKVNKCLNVATSQRRDVSTSRRLNVATTQRRSTLQRHDVSESFSLSIIKSKGGPEFKASKIVRTKARKVRTAATLILKKSPTFVFFFFSDRSTDVL